MDVTLVTSNPGKLREVRSILAPYGVRVRGRSVSLREPQTDSMVEIVRAKLDSVPRVGGTVLVEDSGLFVNALGGFPGVYSAYALRTIGLPGLLRLVRGHNRAAVFRTVAGIRRGSRRWLFLGASKGAIARTVRGENGFGFDPVFISSGETRTYGEMTLEEKNRTSHRARAFGKVGKFLAGRPPAR